MPTPTWTVGRMPIGTWIAALSLGLLAVACGEGARGPQTSNGPVENGGPGLGGPEPHGVARPDFFHSLFEYTSQTDLTAFVSEITALPGAELPLRIGWRTQGTEFPVVDPAAQVAAMVMIDEHYVSEGLVPPSYSYTLYEDTPWTAAKIAGGFSALRSAAAARKVTIDEVLLERAIGGSSVGLVQGLRGALPGVSIAVSTTHLALRSGCASTAATWDRFYLQMYSIAGVDICLEKACSSAYCGSNAPASVAASLAALATGPCRPDPDAFVFVFSYEEATDTDCDGACTTCKPGLMGGTSTVFTPDRYGAFAQAFSNAAATGLGFAPRTGVYVPRNAMRAWSASSAADYEPFKPARGECACPS